MAYGKPSRDVQQEITDSIIAQIEAGAGKWQMPWHSRPGDGFAGELPVNQDGKHYHGLNVVLLWGAAMQKGYTRPIWASHKNWEKLGTFARKGEKGTLIFFWKRVLDDKHARKYPDAAPKYIFYCKAWNVFNIAQVDSIPAKFAVDTAPVPATPEDESRRIAAAEQYFASIPATVNHGGNRAYYTTGGDYIQLPDFDRFKTAEDYYSTRGHESVHWTGHKTRCEREFGKRFGDKAYAFEELVAELGAAFLCAHLGISNEPRPDHAQYLSHWLEVLQGDKYAIFTAATAAQKAVDYLNKAAGESADDDDGDDATGESLPIAA